MRMRPIYSRQLWLILAAGVAIAGCDLFRPSPTPTPRYVLGDPYQRDGFWYYPRESFHLSETGLAAVAANRGGRLTANGEAFDPTLLTAGHQTVQLPAIARVTNLENGLAVVVRINDRGPSRPNRLLELTPRAAQLLRIPAAGGTQIRLDLLDTESHAAIESLTGAPKLDIAAAPREAVRVEGSQPAASAGAPSQQASPARQPERLPEALVQTSLGPGTLFIHLGSFGRAEFAQRQLARLSQFNPGMLAERQGRQTIYRLRIGPLESVRAADNMLDQVIRAGATDARIVVE